MRGLVRGNCLAQSLTIWWLLRRQGILVELRVGVRKQQDCLEAHAWIEHRSRVLNDDSEIRAHYSPFRGARGIFARLDADLP